MPRATFSRVERRDDGHDAQFHDAGKNVAHAEHRAEHLAAEQQHQHMLIVVICSRSRMNNAIMPAMMPAPPNTKEIIAVSAKNIFAMNDFCVPTARIMPISLTRSRAAMLSVFMMMIIATKKMSITNPIATPRMIMAVSAIWLTAPIHDTARA